jgi:hypothetical protein
MHADQAAQRVLDKVAHARESIRLAGAIIGCRPRAGLILNKCARRDKASESEP